MPVVQEEGPQLGPKMLGTHNLGGTQVWSACGGPSLEEHLLWLKDETPVDIKVHNWWCVPNMRWWLAT